MTGFSVLRLVVDFIEMIVHCASIRKSVKPQDVHLKQKAVLWQHPWRNFFSIVQVDFAKPVFGASQYYSVTRMVVEKQPASIVLPYDPVNDQVVLIEQVRPLSLCTGSGEPSLVELCAGIIDVGESAEDAAIRELKEECGLSTSHIEKVSQYWVSQAWTTEITHLFCACVDAANIIESSGNASECESTRVFCVSSDELFTALDAGNLDHGGLLIGALWLARHRARLRRIWTNS